MGGGWLIYIRVWVEGQCVGGGTGGGFYVIVSCLFVLFSIGV